MAASSAECILFAVDASHIAESTLARGVSCLDIFKRSCIFFAQAKVLSATHPLSRARAGSKQQRCTCVCPCSQRRVNSRHLFGLIAVRVRGRAAFNLMALHVRAAGYDACTPLHIIHAHALQACSLTQASVASCLLCRTVQSLSYRPPRTLTGSATQCSRCVASDARGALQTKQKSSSFLRVSVYGVCVSWLPLRSFNPPVSTAVRWS